MQREPRHNSQPDEANALPGVIDTIGNAFGLLSRRPYLVWLPILLDLFLWLGARLSANPLVNVTEHWLREEALAEDEVIEAFRTSIEGFNIFNSLGLFTPTFMFNLYWGATPAAGSANVWIENLPWWAIPPLVGVLIAIAVVFGMVYFTTLAYLVRERPISLGSFVGDSIRNTVHMFGFIGVVFGLLMLLLVPMVIFTTILMVAGVDVSPLTAMLLTMVITWGFVTLFFVRHAIVVTDSGPLRAIYYSYNVVRSYFWPAIGFIIIYFLVRTGMPVALQIFTQSPWSVPFAIIGHAYVATGLIAAGMLFYRDRAQHLTASKAQTTGSRSLSH